MAKQQANLWHAQMQITYRKICDTHKIPKFKYFLSRLAVVFVQYIEAKCWVENEDVVDAAPTGDAPTTVEWSAT